MKTTFALLIMVVGLTTAHAQGTFQFHVNLSGANEVPPNSTGQFSDGSFSLTDNSLTYLVSGPLLFQNSAQPTGVTINGPAAAGSIAPIIFDLGTPSIFPIQPPPGAAFSVSGTINNLTGAQISDLQAGLWYVNVVTPDFPGGEIRGQIMAVPEPSTFMLVGLGAGCLTVLAGRKRE